MTRCRKCGSRVEKDDQYCGDCGERLMAEELMGVGGGMTQKVMGLSDVRYKLGMVYYRKGDVSNAIRIWQKVLEEHPEHEGVRALIAEAEAQRDAL